MDYEAQLSYEFMFSLLKISRLAYITCKVLLHFLVLGNRQLLWNMACSLKSGLYPQAVASHDFDMSFPTWRKLIHHSPHECWNLLERIAVIKHPNRVTYTQLMLHSSSDASQGLRSVREQWELCPRVQAFSLPACLDYNRKSLGLQLQFFPACLFDFTQPLLTVSNMWGKQKIFVWL